MNKDSEYYKSFVLECFRSQETESLLIMSIMATAMEKLDGEDLIHVVPAVHELIKEGRLKPEDARGYIRLRT